jgi:hypothetical protein
MSLSSGGTRVVRDTVSRNPLPLRDRTDSAFLNGQQALQKAFEVEGDDAKQARDEYLSREMHWGHGIAQKINPVIVETSKELKRIEKDATWLDSFIGIFMTTTSQQLRKKLTALKAVRMEAIDSHDKKNEKIVKAQLQQGNSTLKDIRSAFAMLNQTADTRRPPDERNTDETSLLAKQRVIALGHIAGEHLKKAGVSPVKHRPSFDDLMRKFNDAAAL